MHFADRQDAGRRLAKALAHFKGQPAIVYPLPRGGVVLGVEVARELQAPLDLVIPRKIGHPLNPEYAICAITETGEPVCNPRERAVSDPDWLAAEFERARREARRRRERYLGQRQPLDVRGSTAILVDDGIATGLTMRAAIDDLRRRSPARLVVAIPIAPADTAARLEAEVDELVTLDIPRVFLGAIGAYYDDFSQVSDQEVVDLLDRARRERRE